MNNWSLYTFIEYFSSLTDHEKDEILNKTMTMLQVYGELGLYLPGDPLQYILTGGIFVMKKSSLYDENIMYWRRWRMTHERGEVLDENDFIIFRLNGILIGTENYLLVSHEGTVTFYYRNIEIPYHEEKLERAGVVVDVLEWHGLLLVEIDYEGEIETRLYNGKSYKNLALPPGKKSGEGIYTENGFYTFTGEYLQIQNEIPPDFTSWSTPWGMDVLISLDTVLVYLPLEKRILWRKKLEGAIPFLFHKLVIIDNSVYDLFAGEILAIATVSIIGVTFKNDMTGYVLWFKDEAGGKGGAGVPGVDLNINLQKRISD